MRLIPVLSANILFCMQNKLSTLIFILLLACSPGFPQQFPDLYVDKNFDTKKIIASIDSVKISAEEFFLSYEYGPAFVKRENNSKLKHLEYMINEKLLALDGFKRDIDATEDVRSMINEYKNDLAAEELYKKEILPAVKISDAELEKVINKKQHELELKWFYAPNEEELKKDLPGIKANFDSVFIKQINDTVFLDERYLKTTVFDLEKKNPLLAGIIDSLKPGEVSLPIHTEDGWYIVKLVNVWQSMIATQTEYTKIKQEATNILIKIKSDSLSDDYIRQLMLKNSPVIKREAFNLVRSYLGKFYLDQNKYNEWQLEDKLNKAIQSLGEDVNNSILVETTIKKISIKEFLSWFRNRSEYIKLNDDDMRDFSVSLEKLVWRMVRDKLLSQLALEKNYDKSEDVVKQLSWWKDKIVSSAVRNEIASQVRIESGEIAIADTSGKSYAEQMNYEFRKRMFQKIAQLKQVHKVSINTENLSAVPVSSENDNRTIEVYTAKTGGLIPRTPYPTINNEWVTWE